MNLLSLSNQSISERLRILCHSLLVSKSSRDGRIISKILLRTSSILQSQHVDAARLISEFLNPEFFALDDSPLSFASTPLSFLGNQSVSFFIIIITHPHCGLSRLYRANKQNIVLFGVCAGGGLLSTTLLSLPVSLSTCIQISLSLSLSLSLL